MKTIIKLFLFLAFPVLCSCSKTIYATQIVEVSSINVPEKSNHYVYSDDNCDIDYNMWSLGGNVGFLFTNNTDSTIYIDMDKAFYVANGISYDYYAERSYSYKTSSSIGEESTAVAYGWWRTLGLPGSVSNTTTSSSGSSFTITTVEQKIIAIPAHTKKHINGMTIASEIFNDCKTKMKVTDNNSYSVKYNCEESPLQFSNMFTYRIGESGRLNYVVNKFYISGWTNMTKKNALEKVPVSKCDPDQPEHSVKRDYYNLDALYSVRKNSQRKEAEALYRTINKFRTSKGFYVNYEYNSSK